MLKTATPIQTEYYEKLLYPWQDDVLQEFHSDKFYLTGGTCLSRHYYHHRYSDDLDFFFEGNKYNLRSFDTEYRIIQQHFAGLYKMEIAIESEYFKRFFLKKDSETLKMEFIYESTKVIGERVIDNGVRIDTKENIAANKLTAVFGRKTMKDYIDLYYLLQEFDLKQVIKWAENKMVLPDYEGTVMSLFGEKFTQDGILIKPIEEKNFLKFVKKLNEELLKNAKKIL